LTAKCDKLEVGANLETKNSLYTVEPYLRQILSFIGIRDVQTVRAQGMNIPDLAPHAIFDGEKNIEALAL
jgi:FMN-dependent NADH-azoreductase